MYGDHGNNDHITRGVVYLTRTRMYGYHGKKDRITRGVVYLTTRTRMYGDHGNKDCSKIRSHMRPILGYCTTGPDMKEIQLN